MVKVGSPSLKTRNAIVEKRKELFCENKINNQRRIGESPGTEFSSSFGEMPSGARVLSKSRTSEVLRTPIFIGVLREGSKTGDAKRDHNMEQR